MGVEASSPSTHCDRPVHRLGVVAALAVVVFLGDRACGPARAPPARAAWGHVRSVGSVRRSAANATRAGQFGTDRKTDRGTVAPELSTGGDGRRSAHDTQDTVPYCVHSSHFRFSRVPYT
eukprot:4597264-Prymnesium_polylepis.1